MLSFGDPTPFALAIQTAGSRLICQVQTIAHTRAALDCGADIIVAQGSEAGGHGATRATLTLVPEVADLLAHEAPATLLMAAGGIADGRGLAASLMLSADA
jgi:nitronate monooxygenase